MSDTDPDDNVFADLDEQDDFDGEPRSMQDDDQPGARAGNAVAGAVSTFTGNILLLLSRILPGGGRMWRWFINAGYKGLLKTSGGDAIMHIEEEGRLRHEPVKFVRELDDSELEDPRWKTQSGEWWHSNDGSKNTTLKGRVPTVWASARSNELGSSIQAEVAEALDAGDGRVLTENAVVNKQIIQMDGPVNGDAVADGGVRADGAEEYVSVADPGSLQDYLVPLDKALHQRDSGRTVSMNKYYETYPSRVGPEKMKEQENFGRLREMLPGEERAFVIKVLLIAGAIIAAAIMGPSLIQALLGGGGGGGGSVIPLTLGLWG